MQEQQENILLTRLQEIIETSRHTTGEQTSYVQRHIPPVTSEELDLAEAQIGFTLPALLRRVYLEVGNGGFGPGYGLFPLQTSPLARSNTLNALVEAYQSMRSMSQHDIDEHWADEEEKPSLWPECVLMLCDWGCNIYSCLDCSVPELTIYRMDSNANFMNTWAVEAPSLYQWLEWWIDGKPLFFLDWEHATLVPVAQIGKAFSF